MEFTKDEIEIFKNVIRDYEEFKKEIDERVEKGYTMENLLDYVRHLSSCNITNVDLVDDFKYIDINYIDMTISILQEKEDKPYLGDSLEVWNDGLCYYIGLFNNTNELKALVKEYEENDKN